MIKYIPRFPLQYIHSIESTFGNLIITDYNSHLLYLTIFQLKFFHFQILKILLIIIQIKILTISNYLKLMLIWTPIINISFECLNSQIIIEHSPIQIRML